MIRREKGRRPRPRDPPPVPALKAWEGNDVLDDRPPLRCEEEGNGREMGRGGERKSRGVKRKGKGEVREVGSEGAGGEREG